MATNELATDGQNHQLGEDTNSNSNNSIDSEEKAQDEEQVQKLHLQHKQEPDSSLRMTPETTANARVASNSSDEDDRDDNKAEHHNNNNINNNDKNNNQGDDNAEDEDLEEGELKDDDEDDDDDEEDNLLEDPSKRISSYNVHNNINNNSGNLNNNSNINSNDNLPHQSPHNHQQHHQNIAGGPLGPGTGYPRGGPGGVGPMQKPNIRCRFYSKTSNKCTWGDHCRFEHRDDSPGPDFDNRAPQTQSAGSGRGPPGGQPGLVQMGPSDCVPPYQPYGPGRHQPYPGPPPMGPMGPAERCPPYPPYGAGRHHQPYPHLAPPMGPVDRGHPYPPYGAGRHQPYPAPPPPPMMAGALSPNYPSPSSSSSSSVVYDRKHRLAYELAPWNDRGYPAPPPPNHKYDRGDPSIFPPGGNPRGFYRGGHYPREGPYGREPGPHLGGGPHPSYPSNYPSAYGGGPMEAHPSHYNKYMGSSQRNVAPDTRRSRSNKRGHDEDESSWSDSGSEDSILGQSTFSSHSGSKANKPSHHQHHHHHNQNQNQPPQQQSSQQLPENNSSLDEPPEQGSGTPPGEPLPEDRERQEMLLNKLKEIEDLMAKKKGEQEDPST